MIESVGGKKIEVRVHGDEVVIEWTDPVDERAGDMLLCRESALGLVRRLMEAVQSIDADADGDDNTMKDL